MAKLREREESEASEDEPHAKRPRAPEQRETNDEERAAAELVERLRAKHALELEQASRPGSRFEQVPSAGDDEEEEDEEFEDG